MGVNKHLVGAVTNLGKVGHPKFQMLTLQQFFTVGQTEVNKDVKDEFS